MTGQQREGAPVARKPFEIIAECPMPGFPTAGDIDRIRAQIDQARTSRPEVVRATVSSPAIYRDRQYVLDTRFVVWAEDSAAATRTVEELLRAADVPCRTVVPSGRALTEAETAPPAKVSGTASGFRGTGSRRRSAARRTAQTVRGATPPAGAGPKATAPVRAASRPPRKATTSRGAPARPTRRVASPVRRGGKVMGSARGGSRGRSRSR
jgi:hypothetical protein